MLNLSSVGLRLVTSFFFLSESFWPNYCNGPRTFEEPTQTLIYLNTHLWKDIQCTWPGKLHLSVACIDNFSEICIMKNAFKNLFTLCKKKLQHKYLVNFGTKQYYLLIYKVMITGHFNLLILFFKFNIRCDLKCDYFPSLLSLESLFHLEISGSCRQLKLLINVLLIMK